MTVPRNVAVETCLGYFYGRDCMYLDGAGFENQTADFVLKGRINGNLCTKSQPDEFVLYRLRFLGVLALRMIELDSHDAFGESCFDEILNSDWVRSLGGKVTPEFRHFYVQTYDDVFDVVCLNYEFMIDKAE